MIAGVKQLQQPVVRMPCFAHTLNLIVKKSLHKIYDIRVVREKSRRLITYFKLSSATKDKLTELKSILGLSCHKQKLEVETRWNSTYEMFQRLHELRSAIVLVISNLKIHFEKLIDVVREVIGKMMPMLKPFLLAMAEMSAEKTVTVLKIILIKKQLSIFLCNHLEEKGIKEQLSLELMSQMDAYSGGIEENETYVIFALLDPRFHELSFTVDLNFTTAREKLIINANAPDLRLSSALPIFQTVLQSSSSSRSTIAGEESNFWFAFDNCLRGKNRILVEYDIDSGISNYLKEPYLERKMNPLMYWKENAKKYCKTSVFARRYFCIMRISILADRIFLKPAK